MEYTEALDLIFNRRPAYERQGDVGYKPGLAMSEALDAATGHPHRRYKTLHVAGTNGKGSVASMLAAVLMQAGYKVGLYTSPHYVDFAERIRVNGECISHDAVVAFVERSLEFDLPGVPSFFELTTAMAFEHFARCGVDVAVVEVGLGGRLDSTNIITPVVSVITNVSLEHTSLLGDTIEAIAAEKAGIIKPGVPVVLGRGDAAVRAVVAGVAAERHSPLTVAAPAVAVAAPVGAAVAAAPVAPAVPVGAAVAAAPAAPAAPVSAAVAAGDCGGKEETFTGCCAARVSVHATALQLPPRATATSCSTAPAAAATAGSAAGLVLTTPCGVVTCDLVGDYQVENVNTALTALFVVREQLPWNDGAVVQGLSRVGELTGLRGRWSRVMIGGREVLTDAAHNPDALARAMRALREQCPAGARQHIVLGFMADKDVATLIALLPRDARYYCTQAATPRALPAGELCRAMCDHGLRAEPFGDVRAAVAAATARAAARDLIYLGGSMYLQGELFAALGT